jgi:NAD(P)H-nitrite reductase large subunit
MMVAVLLDDKICYCFHVSLRKLVNYARRECPQKASQMSECLGAGTGCGWCIPILQRIHQKTAEGVKFDENQDIGDLPKSTQEYADGRSKYLKSDDKNTF